MTDNQGTSSQASEDLTPKHAKVEPPKKKKGGIVALSILLAILLIIVGCGVGFLVWHQLQLSKAAEDAANTAIPETEVKVEEAKLPDNPIDFQEQWLTNGDVYAWIYIPNTKVNYPIVQNSTDDFYYLAHDINGDIADTGAIYTELANSMDFTDPVTVIYGHNIQGDLMFSSLHYFENADFFNENQTIYIYTPGHILTYTIASAYQYDDRHILNSFDFTEPSVIASYFNYVLNPESMLVNVRNGVTLGQNDKIIQLSTCMTNYSHTNTRYIVTGVLTNDQPTN